MFFNQAKPKKQQGDPTGLFGLPQEPAAQKPDAFSGLTPGDRQKAVRTAVDQERSILGAQAPAPSPTPSQRKGKGGKGSLYG